ncbi:hypothetical protein [Streptomyces sp. NPDC012888]|uniref:hypothetical protein n=1 Tax=Streptomyces sp. NPDC012888 TaxID=3364855 RepID=UPI0036B70352
MTTVKPKTIALTAAAVLLVAAAVGAASVLETTPVIATNHEAMTMTFRADDDAQLAGHSDEVVWVEITDTTTWPASLTEDLERVTYDARVLKAFKGTPPETIEVEAVYEGESVERMKEGGRYVLAADHDDAGGRHVVYSSYPVETASLDVPDTRHGAHNAELRQPAPSTQAERWTRAVTHAITANAG